MSVYGHGPEIISSTDGPLAQQGLGPVMCQQGWCLFSMSTGEALLTFEAAGGQLVLKDRRKHVRFSFAVRRKVAGGVVEYPFVQAARFLGVDGMPNVELGISTRKEAVPTTICVGALEILEATRAGVEVIDV